MRKISTILFDIGNVFLYADHSITHKFLTKEYSVPLEKAKKFFTIPEYNLFSRGKIENKQFSNALRRILTNNSLDDNQLKEAHNIHIVRPIKSAMKVLETIHKKGIYNIAFLTNTNVWQNEREKKLVDFTKYSNIIVRSNEEGLTKNSPQLFTRTLSRLKNKDVLFVDDSVNNIKTARSLGINSLFVTKNNPKLYSTLRSKGVHLN